MFRVFSQYVSAKRVLSMILEALLIVLCLLFAVKLRFWSEPAEASLYIVFPDFAVQTAVVVLVCLASFYFNDIYEPTVGGLPPMERIMRTEQALGTASLFLGALYFFFPGLLLSRGVLIIGMLLVASLSILSRRLLDKAWQLTAPIQRIAILGTGQLALELAREVGRQGDLGMKLEGFISSTGEGIRDEAIFGIPVLGAADEMEPIAKKVALSRIIVALEDRRGALPTRELVTLRVQGMRVDDAATALSALTGRIALRAVRPSWFVFSEGFHRSRRNALLKRTLDLTAGVAGLILSLPIMALVALAVWLDSGGPVLYRQERVGRMGRVFELLKFRSMKTDAEKESGAQWAQENDPRVTRVGRILRSYRLDELPQFINVIRGEMSFVGPRPERPCFVKELRTAIPYYDERHSVRPGVTGWAQVQYKYGASLEDAFNKLEYDLFYLKNMSVTFDLAIIFQTIRIVMSGQGGT